MQFPVILSHSASLLQEHRVPYLYTAEWTDTYNGAYEQGIGSEWNDRISEGLFLSEWAVFDYSKLQSRLDFIRAL